MAWKSPADGGALLMQRFCFESGPGMRITTTGLAPREANKLANAIAEAVGSRGGTYSG